MLFNKKRKMCTLKSSFFKEDSVSRDARQKKLLDKQAVLLEQQLKLIKQLMTTCKNFGQE